MNILDDIKHKFGDNFLTTDNVNYLPTGPYIGIKRTFKADLPPSNQFNIDGYLKPDSIGHIVTNIKGIKHINLGGYRVGLLPNGEMPTLPLFALNYIRPGYILDSDITYVSYDLYQLSSKVIEAYCGVPIALNNDIVINYGLISFR
jgi:hypothetical protein